MYRLKLLALTVLAASASAGTLNINARARLGVHRWQRMWQRLQ